MCVLCLLYNLFIYSFIHSLLNYVKSQRLAAIADYGAWATLWQIKNEHCQTDSSGTV